MKKSKNIFVVFNKGEIRRLKEFLLINNEENFLVLSFDSVISYHLDKKGIKHLNMNDLISFSEQKKLFSASYNKIVKIFNTITINLLDEGNIHFAEFLDCVKFELINKITDIFYLELFYSAILKKLTPKNVYFYGNDYFYPKIFINQLKKDNITFYKMKNYFLTGIDNNLNYYISLLGKKNWKENLLHFMYEHISLVKIFINWEIHKVNKIDIKNLDYDKEYFLFSPFPYYDKSYFKALVSISKEFGRKAIFGVSLGISNLGKIKLSGKIPVFYISDNVNHLNKVKEKRLQSFILSLDKKIFGLNDYDYLSYLNIEKDYFLFIDYLTKYNNLLNKIKIKAIFSWNMYDLSSRTMILSAQKSDILSFGFSDLGNQVFDPINYLEKDNKIYNLVFSDYFPVISQKYFKVYNKIKLIKNKINFFISGSIRTNYLIKKRDEVLKYRRKLRYGFINKYNLPCDSKIILYTPQQHKYTFDYAKILTDIIIKLNNGRKREKIYLLIKPHPSEFSLFYKLKTLKSKYVIVNKNINIYEAINLSDLVITSHSITLIESIFFYKKVLLINFSHRIHGPGESNIFHFRTDITNLPFYTSVSNITELEQNILVALNSEIEFDKKYFNSFFNLKTNFSEAYKNKVKRVLKLNEKENIKLNSK